jgi:hypothetical protein
MTIVFRKRIVRDHFQLGGEGHVIVRYPLPVERHFTETEIASIASQLYQEEYGHSFRDDEGVYYTLE